jgi:hypothetical protein
MNARAQAVTGVAIERCHTITIQNAANGVPVVSFSEERLVTLADGSIMRTPPLSGAMQLVLQFDPHAQIPLRDPVTDELTGAFATQEEAHRILYSAYRALKLQREAEGV